MVWIPGGSNPWAPFLAAHCVPPPSPILLPISLLPSQFSMRLWKVLVIASFFPLCHQDWGMVLEQDVRLNILLVLDPKGLVLAEPHLIEAKYRVGGSRCRKRSFLEVFGLGEEPFCQL